MKNNYTRLRLTGRQYASILELDKSLQLGEAFIALCGQTTDKQNAPDHTVYMVHDINPNPINESKEWLDEFESWSKKKNGLVPLVILSGRINDYQTKLIMEKLDKISCEDTYLKLDLNDEVLSGHCYSGETLEAIDKIIIAGSDITIFESSLQHQASNEDTTIRLEQAFGSKTKNLLSTLKVGVVGISGTGSPICEMLFRLGVKEMILVDSDKVESKNLDRIFNTTYADAEQGRFKVDVTRDAFMKIDCNRKVTGIRDRIQAYESVIKLAQCDVIFGCMDTHSGRFFLNRLCNFYSIPYFDAGVKLKADGKGGVSEICGAIHYLQPDGSTLVSRRVVDMKRVESEDLQFENPEMYKQQFKEKYIVGGKEESPAVISINTTVASHTVNDFLARIHPYRNEENSNIETIALNLCEPEFVITKETEPQIDVYKYLGLGDRVPLMNMPLLSPGE